MHESMNIKLGFIVLGFYKNITLTSAAF